MAAARNLLDERAHPALAPALQVAVAVAAAVALCWLGGIAWALPEGDYEHPCLTLRLAAHPGALALTLLLTAALAWPRLAWRHLEPRPIVRGVVLATCLTLAWAYGSMPYNPYFGQLYTFDRALVYVLAPLVLVHPAFIVPFLAVLNLLMHQVDHPLHLHSFTPKQPLLQVLYLLAGMLLVKLLVPAAPMRRFLLLAVSCAASWYLYPALQKLRIGWLAHEDLYRLIMAARDNGWLGSMDAPALATIERVVGVLNMPLLLATVVLETSALVILWRRHLTVAMLVSFVLLHVGIFAASGICFWKWAFLDLALAAGLLALPPEERPLLWSRSSFRISLVLIAGAGLWFQPVPLGWLDSPLSQVFRVEVVGASGRVYEVPPRLLAPYDHMMAQGRLAFVTRERVLAGTYGLLHRSRDLVPLVAAQSGAEVLAVIADRGKVRYNEERAAVATRFFTRFFADHNRHPGRRSGFELLRPPQHQWTGPVTGLPLYDASEAVTRVRLRLVTSWLRAGRAEVLAESVVLDAEVPR